VEAHLHMWLELLVRWAHFIVGIAWIGASFYFNWLENHLQREQRPDGVAGDLWAVHGGGFYYLKKFAVAPGELPPTLHWFKWEAYATWISGMTLLIIMFYWNAQTYMLKPGSGGISAGAAIAIGAGSLLASWVFYDLLCRSALAQREWLTGLLLLTWFALLAWILSSWLSDRAAYIHVGAAIGTVMVANVFRVIIPAHRELVDAVSEQRTPDASKGLNALQRSRHNNYFTLPVLFIMLSAHYPATYGHPYNWLVLLVFSLAAVAIRHFFNIRHLPGFTAWPLIPAALLLVGLILFTAPGTRSLESSVDVDTVIDTDTVLEIVHQRCSNCHAAVPEFAGLATAPLGVELDTSQKLELHAHRVFHTTVTVRTMPLGNLTRMTEEERQIIADWYGSRTAGEP
jgi:uncharacterized membrane protein